jgi:DNA-binding MarR family transcriptional regulator
VTQIVNGLARAGLVSRRAAPRDARVTLVEITVRGRSRIGAMLAKAKAREDFAVAALGARDVQRLKDLLRRLLERGED